MNTKFMFDSLKEVTRTGWLWYIKRMFCYQHTLSNSKMCENLSSYTLLGFSIFFLRLFYSNLIMSNKIYSEKLTLIVGVMDLLSEVAVTVLDV